MRNNKINSMIVLGTILMTSTVQGQDRERRLDEKLNKRSFSELGTIFPNDPAGFVFSSLDPAKQKAIAAAHRPLINRIKQEILKDKKQSRIFIFDLDKYHFTQTSSDGSVEGVGYYEFSQNWTATGSLSTSRTSVSTTGRARLGGAPYGDMKPEVVWALTVAEAELRASGELPKSGSFGGGFGGLGGAPGSGGTVTAITATANDVQTRESDVDRQIVAAVGRGSYAATGSYSKRDPKGTGASTDSVGLALDYQLSPDAARWVFAVSTGFASRKGFSETSITVAIGDSQTIPGVDLSYNFSSAWSRAGGAPDSGLTFDMDAAFDLQFASVSLNYAIPTKYSGEFDYSITLKRAVNKSGARVFFRYAKDNVLTFGLTTPIKT